LLHCRNPSDFLHGAPLDPDRFQGLSLFNKNATLPRESSHEDS
jgi:hypothetical protein